MQIVLRVASLGYILTAICPEGLHGKCTSPQYGEIGQEGIIKCVLPSSFNGVIWYDSEDTTTTSQIVLVERQSDGSFRTSGQGFDSGEYRISSNGSLIIPIVSIHHDRNFTVFSLDSNDEVFQAMVEFKTVVRPSMSVPAVNSCEEDNLCLINFNMVKTDTLTCTLSQARPAVVVSWHHQIEGNLENMFAQNNVKSDGQNTFTSTSKVNVSELINTSVRVFSCNASGPALSHGKYETIVVVYNIDIESINSHQHNILQKIVVINRSLEIPCKDHGTPMIFVWSFKGLSTSSVLAFSAQGEKRLIGNVNHTFDVLQDGTIIFEHVDYQLEGIFICTSIERGESSTFMLRVKVVGHEAEQIGKVLNICVGIFLALVFLAIASGGVWYVRKRKVSIINT
ncbi:hypothetical protein HOLleu_09355 [Holothuria leucospilota]|uniref:Ig-like domain-containing protein n=1 Tax=Holothuria leucospilota TaxID=206669 RepID=A0A9Q1CDK8_HOLLE|nr:hypothetical protein HOLleu_09355 [Holothuria leucospilota]